jgi:hypothetical protein
MCVKLENLCLVGSAPECARADAADERLRARVHVDVGLQLQPPFEASAAHWGKGFVLKARGPFLTSPLAPRGELRLQG